MSTTRIRPVRGLVAAAALVAVPLISLLPAPDASAASTTVVSGSAGEVSTHGPMITAIGDSASTLSFRSAGVNVGLVPGDSQRQVVTGKYAASYRTVDGWWALFRSTPSMSREATTDAPATFPGWDFAKPVEVSSPRDYRVTFTVIWRDAVTHDVLGTAQVTPDQQGDLSCATTGLACQMLDSHLRV